MRPKGQHISTKRPKENDPATCSYFHYIKNNYCDTITIPVGAHKLNIDYTKTLQEINGNLAIWCSDTADAPELIYAADSMVTYGFNEISVFADSVYMLWSWLEGKGIDIYARINTTEKMAGSIARDISGFFKKGASGAQIFVEANNLSFLVSELLPIKDDLFFKKKLQLAINLNSIGPFDWSDIFYQAKKIGADSILLYSNKMLEKKSKNNATDVIGQVYALLDSVDFDIGIGLRFFFTEKTIENTESTFRLIKKLRPEFLKNTKFFVDTELCRRQFCAEQ